MTRHIDDHPIVRRKLSRRDFLRRASAAGIAMPTAAALLAACGSGAQTGVGGSPPASSGGSNPYGTGGIAGAPYPLARPDAPVTWTIQPDNQPIASGTSPESGATLQVLRWPYYLDDGVLKAFEKKYKCKVQITEAIDMDKLLQKVAAGQAPFDLLVGMNVWAIGRSI